MGESFVRKYWIYVVLGIFAINALILDLFVFFPKSQPAPTTLTKNVDSTNVSQDYCPQGCLSQIDLALKSQKVSPSPTIKAILAQNPTPLASPSSRPTSAPTPSPTPTPIKTTKEFFVPLGSGTGKPADWTVVDGIGAKIDPADYGDIKSVTLEVFAQIPTASQTIWIRLYNANNYQFVPGSELTMNGNNGVVTLLTSSPLTLFSGNSLYQIQIKTQLQADTNITMARLRIKTK